MAKLEPYMGSYYLWHYVPLLTLAIICTVLFSISTALHTWRMFRTRAWFCIPFTIGGYFEIIGYAGTCASNFNTSSMASYVIANDGTLLAPALFAATIYMTLGRVMSRVKGEKYSFVPIRYLTKIFVAGDILSFIVQGASLGFTITMHDTAGTVVVELGLCVQVVSFGVFVVTAVVFHRRLTRNSSSGVESGVGGDWLAHLRVLYCVSALIMVRSLFRVLLYAGGQYGYIMDNEWPIYVFDSLPMAVVMVVFFFRYPNELRSVGTYELEDA